MNKSTRIVLDVFVILVGIGLLIWGISDAIKMYNYSKMDDNVKFARSYTSVGKDNIYKYTNLKEVSMYVEKGTGILLIGKTTDPWMQVLARPLNDVSKDYVDNIYYLELDDIDTEDKNYKKIVDKVGELSSLEVLIIKDGKVLTKLYKDDLIDSSYNGIPIEYFDDEDRVLELEEKVYKIRDLE